MTIKMSSSGPKLFGLVRVTCSLISLSLATYGGRVSLHAPVK